MAKDTKENKKNIAISTDSKLLWWAVALVVLLIIIAISFTYAYFSRNVTQTGDDSSTNMQTGVLAVDFVTGEYIANTNAMLIYDDEAYQKADKSIFSVERSELNTVERVYYTLDLVDISITDNLKSKYLKWRLYETQEITETTEALSEGDFLDIVDNKIALYSTKIPLAKNAKHNFTLLIWLSNDDETNQNDLLQGTISAKIQVTAVNEA